MKYIIYVCVSFMILWILKMIYDTKRFENFSNIYESYNNFNEDGGDLELSGEDDDEFEMEEWEKDVSVERNVDKFLGLFDVSIRNDNSMRGIRDGRVFKVPHYDLIFCVPFRQSVLKHYIVVENENNRTKYRDGKRFFIPGYILTYKKPPVDPDCPICPDCPTIPKREEFEEIYRGNGDDMYDNKNGEWRFGKILYDDGAGCDENYMTTEPDSATKICCEKGTGEKLICRGKWDLGDGYKLIEKKNVVEEKKEKVNLVLYSNKDPSTDDSRKNKYNSISYEYVGNPEPEDYKKFSSGLFIIDVVHVPNSSLFSPKLLLKTDSSDSFLKNDNNNVQEINILNVLNLKKLESNNPQNYQLLAGSSLFVPDVGTKEKCYQTFEGGMRVDCSNRGTIENPGCHVDSNNTLDEINSGGGVFACLIKERGEIKIWYIPKYTMPPNPDLDFEREINPHYLNAVSGSPLPSQWKDPYVIFQPCSGSFENMTLTIQTEFKQPIISPVPPIEEPEDARWEIRSVKIYKEKLQII